MSENEERREFAAGQPAGAEPGDGSTPSGMSGSGAPHDLAEFEKRVREARVIVEDSRRTHLQWAEWQKNGNAAPDEIGDAAFHAEQVSQYDVVLRALEDAKFAVEIARAWKEHHERHHADCDGTGDWSVA